MNYNHLVCVQCTYVVYVLERDVQQQHNIKKANNFYYYYSSFCFFFFCCFFAQKHVIIKKLQHEWSKNKVIYTIWSNLDNFISVCTRVRMYEISKYSHLSSIFTQHLFLNGFWTFELMYIWCWSRRRMGGKKNFIRSFIILIVFCHVVDLIRK